MWTPGSTSCENVATCSPFTDAHGADLGDLAEARGGARGLEVDDREDDVGEVAALVLPGGETDVHVALPGEALVAAHDVVDHGARELGRAVGDGEEAGPDLAVVESFAGLLEESEELVDGRERELHEAMLPELKDGCTVPAARRHAEAAGRRAAAQTSPGARRTSPRGRSSLWPRASARASFAYAVAPVTAQPSPAPPAVGGRRGRGAPRPGRDLRAGRARRRGLGGRSRGQNGSAGRRPRRARLAARPARCARHLCLVSSPCSARRASTTVAVGTGLLVDRGGSRVEDRMDGVLSRRSSVGADPRGCADLSR